MRLTCDGTYAIEETPLTALSEPVMFASAGGPTLRYPPVDLDRFAFPVNELLDRMADGTDVQLVVAAGKSGHGVWVELGPGRVAEILVTLFVHGDMHLGHRNVPTQKGGNLEDVNVCLEGAACNLSAGARGYVKPGRSCAERGSCGAPYKRDD